MTEPSKFIQILKDFCRVTTVHGLFHLSRTKYPLKFLWIILCGAMLFCTVWYCAMSVLQYLRFDIKTTITYENLQELDFPAVSFCNQFQYRRSVVGSNPMILIPMTMLMAGNIKELPYLIKQGQIACKSNMHSIYDNFTAEDMQKMNMKELQKSFAVDSFTSITKCWWATKEFDCNGTFANRVLDQGYCSMFIPNKWLGNYIQNSELAAIFYGSNENVIFDRILNNSGPANGLQLLLNVEQNEHCDAARNYEGAGFTAVIHDPVNFNPSISLVSAINLQPGYAIDVILQPSVFNRETAFLGLCNSSNYFIRDRQSYFKSLCVMFCFIRSVVEVCKCVPRTLIPEVDNGLMEFYSMNTSNIKDCVAEDIICATTEQTNTYRKTDSKDKCPECLQPCFETTYQFLVTRRKFPSQNQGDYFVQLLNKTNVTEVRKNFLLINIFFESLTVIKVVESQAFTLLDSFIYIGNVIGLFMGMSFMIGGEIFQLITQEIFQVFKNMKEKSTTIVIELSQMQVVKRHQIEKKCKIVHNGGALFLKTNRMYH